MFSIRKSSTELNDISEPRWHFPSALRVDLNPMAYDIDFDETEIDTFIAWRPDCLALDKQKKVVFVSRIH